MSMRLYNKDKQFLFNLDLSKQLNSGGEGTIYENPNNPKEVIKIYHPTVNVSLTEKVVMDLGGLPLNFIKPKQLFYDLSYKVVGYTMDYIDTKKYFPLSNFFTKKFCESHNVDYKTKTKLIENLLTGLDLAHKANIVIGDVNQYNILCGLNGDVIFIDVDSFQTPTRKHNGVMMDDIRDWTTDTINEMSDYYSMSVNIFQILTHIHPYKGVHKTYKNLEQRVLKNISVLSGDSELIIPAIYEPIANTNILKQFKDLYQNRKRFLLELGNNIGVVVKTAVTLNLNSNELFIKLLTPNCVDFKASQKYLCVFDGKKNNIVGLPNLGLFNNIGAFDGQVFVGENGFVYEKNDTFYNDKNEEVKYFRPTNVFEQNGSLFSYTDGNFQVYDLNNITKTVNSTVGVLYTKGLTVGKGLYQTISGFKYLLALNKTYFNSVKTEINVLDYYLRGNIGIVKHNQKGVVKYNFFRIEGLKFVIGNETDSLADFDVKNDLIYLPSDKKIKVIRAFDYSLIAEINTDLVNEQSKIVHTQSGMLVQTDNNLYLMNKK